MDSDTLRTVVNLRFSVEKILFSFISSYRKERKKNDTRSNLVEIKQENDFSLIIIRRKMRQREREREMAPFPAVYV